MMTSIQLESPTDRKTLLYSFLACYAIDYKAQALKPINVISQIYSAIVKGKFPNFFDFLLLFPTLPFKDWPLYFPYILYEGRNIYSLTVK